MTTKVSRNMPPRDLLVIAYVFPPIAYAGTFRSMRLCKYLARIGHNVQVLTIEEQKDLHNDPALLAAVQDLVTIHRTRTVDLWRWYQPRKKKLTSSLPGRLLNKLVCLLLDMINQPDHMLFWIPFAVKRGFSLCRASKNLVLYTSSPPHSEHWIGYALKKLCNRKWLADLRDPITGNIVSADWNPYQRLVHVFLEKRILNNADAVIVNTNAAKQELLARYPGRNIHHVGNSFDPDDFATLPQEKFPRFTLAHVGSFYKFRKIDVILQAMACLREQGQITPQNFRLLLVGMNDPRVGEEVEKSGVREMVEINPMVSHREALEIMVRSHLLLLIKGFGPNSANQIPGKLFEYAGSGNPILYLGPSKSEAADIVRALGTGTIIEDDPEQTSAALLHYLGKHRQPEAQAAPATSSRCLAFSSATMAEKIHAISQAL